ncbi:GbsR/MarR family transcriptional regulator [Anaerobacillus alkalilacustris]|uniref:HTH-type transcriptional regulator n=1 Tax=Anaerobacillus alkalilacustris TaxID=393763 RepID=A0A1S2LRV4_9BACI|nr:GbsR/MarR family transcriptional regulator [Anaerobacillus alkalilacustris]OIJ15116.1 GbsR/MarR family transcriptional regulator [Anaerobacillus alkalilacustris]
MENKGKETKELEDFNDLKKAREHFVSEVAKNIYLYDISHSVGRLYGTVFFAEEPMTLDDMSEALGMSKTSMSTGIRALLEADMVERVWEKGIRKDLYKTEDDWYKSFSNVFINRWRNATVENTAAIEETKGMLEELNDQTTSEKVKKLIKSDLKKLSQAEAYYTWLDEVISLFETGKIFGIVPKQEPK